MPKGWDGKKMQDDPDSPHMSESTIWSDQVTTGFFRKKVIETRYITNLRVSTNRGVVYLDQVDDIIVMNSKRMSESQYSGYSAGRYTRYGMGTAKSSSRTVGDVVFMSGGQPVITIDQVQDPHGVARLAKAARKGLISQMKFEEKDTLQEQESKNVDQQIEQALNLRSVSSTDSLNGRDLAERNPPDINWRIAHSMVASELVRSFEYPIQLIKWIDDKPNEYYNRMIIHPIEKGNYMVIKNDLNKETVLTIEIKDLVDVSVIPNNDDPLGVKIGTDVKLQLTVLLFSSK